MGHGSGPLTPLLYVTYRSRQDAIEALEIAAGGKVTCHYAVRQLEELETNAWILFSSRGFVCTHFTCGFSSVFNEMKRGEIAGRVVLKI